MKNQPNPVQNEKQNPPSTPNSLPPPESNPSAPPPSYPGPAHYPSPGMISLQYYPPPVQGMGYPQPYEAAPGGHPYYPQPGVVCPAYPADTKYPAAPPPQQLQQLFVTSNMSSDGTAQNGAPVSMVGAFILSFIAYIFAAFVCGVVAFTIAILGRKAAASGNSRSAIQLRNVSYGLSIFGIIGSCVLAAIYLGVFLSPAFTTDPTWLTDIINKYNATGHRIYQ